LSDLTAKLDRVLNPRTVAIVGDKQAFGYMWLRNMSEFRGRVYSVQVDPKEVPGIEALGVPNYDSLLDVPDDIDYVVCAVPRKVAPRIVADCVRKGVGGVTLFTSGFAETGEEEGRRLQNEIGELAREGGLPLIGPNCMGLYNPALGVRQSVDQPVGEAGTVGFVSQSGTHAINFSLMCAANGIGISKAISIGNAIVLDVADYLEYLAHDEATEVIGLYVEGVGDGRRLFTALREACRTKPLVVWKGGQSEAGHRATFSHTGALASSPVIWDAVVRQCGAATADSIDEAVDVVKAFAYAKQGTGRRVGLLAMTGGQSVVITDAFVGAGLEVPLLADASYEKLASFFNIIGGSYRNPLDIGGTIRWGGQPENLERILDILDGDENVDAVVIEAASGLLARHWRSNPQALDDLLDRLVAYQRRSSKPFFTVMHAGHLEAELAEARDKAAGRGLATFASFERAARALRRTTDYWRFRAGLD
jgi:acyl-CoA synthetase (NDP forming)